MKTPIKNFLISVFSIAILAHLIPGVSYQSDLKILLLAAFILSLVNFIVKPILKIIFLPINLITFGIAGWLIQVILLYLTALFVDGFTISTFVLGPTTILGISLPRIVFSGVWAYVGSAFVLNFISSFLYWIL